MALGSKFVDCFLHGVASGDPRNDRVIIWTRVSSPDPGPVEVSWQVSTRPDFQDIAAENACIASAEDDYTVKVDVDHLEPGARYYYRFRALGQFSPIGRTKTLPHVGVAQIRFALACCAKLNFGFFNAYSRIADRSDLDFFLHLGDYIYETAEHSSVNRVSGKDPSRAYDPLTECKTLADYRRRYARYRLDPDLQRLHQALPMIATLDDHEIADGAWRDGAEDHDSGRDGAWADRRRAALKARWEWLPLRIPDRNDPERIFHSVSIGKLIDLMVLDTRTLRDRPSDGPAAAGPERTALGQDQRDWLLRELQTSQSHWRLIASPTLMVDLMNESLPLSCKQALRKLKLINPENDGPDSDPWAGYPYERALILRHIHDRNISNVVVLSGDVHVSLASVLRWQGSEEIGAAVAVEFVTPSVTSQNLDDKMGWTPRTGSLPIEQDLMESLPGLRWCELDSHGYAVIDVTAERVHAEWWFVDTVLSESSRETCGGAWEGASGLTRLSEITRQAIG